MTVDAMTGDAPEGTASDVLESLGWDDDRDRAFEPERPRGLEPARIVAQHRGGWTVRTATGELIVTLGGRLRFDATSASDLPAVGDWVALAASQVQAVLPRRQALIRRAADSDATEQVIAANVETVVIVTSMNRDFNVRRLERLVSVAWESAGAPVIVLSKADLVDEAGVAAFRAQVKAVAPGVPVIAASVRTGLGLDELRAALPPRRTAAFIGSSGVGKSTLVNTLAGREVIATAPIREDDGRGRHTTTGRELHVLPGGWLLLDTPGIREVGLWATDEGLERTFEDVAELARQCRFNDCQHQQEPGCAVRAAIASGVLPVARFEAHHKLEQELARVERARDPRARAAEARRWRTIQKSVNEHMTRKYGDDR